MSTSLASKLLEVQRTIGTLTKDHTNPFHNSKYADLNQVLALAKETLNPRGIFFFQKPDLNEHGRYVETVLTDVESGQSIFSRVPYSGNEKNAQEIKASTTYFRRVGLISLLGMEEVDDDGEAASGRGQQGSSASVGAKPNRVAGVSPKPVTTVSKGSTRSVLNDKISATSRVLIAKKAATQDEIEKLLGSYGVKTKEELTDDQAAELLNQLEGKL